MVSLPGGFFDKNGDERKSLSGTFDEKSGFFHARYRIKPFPGKRGVGKTRVRSATPQKKNGLGGN